MSSLSWVSFTIKTVKPAIDVVKKSYSSHSLIQKSDPGTSHNTQLTSTPLIHHASTYSYHKTKSIETSLQAHKTMETGTNVSIESCNTDENKLILERMVCDDRRSQYIDTDKDWWNKKMPNTDHRLTTKKRKSPVDTSIMEELEEEEEGQFSSSEQLLFKNLSEAISEYQEPSEQRRHQGRARSKSHDGPLDMASLQLSRNPSSEEPIIPNKRPRCERRNSFVIRRDKNSPFPPRSLLEGNDDDEDNPLNRSAPNLFSPKPEMPSDMEAWGNLSWSNTNDTTCYKFSSMSFDAEPIIREPPSKSASSSQRNTSGSTTRSPDTHHHRASVCSSLAMPRLQTEDHMDTLDETEEPMCAPRLLPRSFERRFSRN
jgi:hypothetical protein